MNDEKDSAQNTDASLPSESKPDVVVQPTAKPKRLPLIRSITHRTTMWYVLFALILLAVLWTAFFVGLYAFYGRLIERDADDVARIASEAFPKHVGDNSMSMMYKARLSDIARDNAPVVIVVFSCDEAGEKNVEFSVDGMGNDTSAGNGALFDAVMSKISFDGVFSAGEQSKVKTDYGTYVCSGRVNRAEDGEAYLLVLKSYEIFNPQTLKLVYILLACTFVVLIIACVYAIVASRFQTKLLTDFSQKAKLLADGDYSAEFCGYGYNEYESLANALNSATRNMQNAERLQRDIIANVSHDIRTPLTMIRGYAEMLRDMPIDEKKREKIAGVIITESDRLTALVTDVLDYSRLSSGVAEFKPALTDLSAVARGVLERFDFLRERDGIKLLHDIDDNAEAVCDRQKIEQVLYNLISNAINYCGDDKTVILRVKKKHSAVRAEVIDHGKGIDASEIDSVWDRYYRSAHARRTSVGSGLGLSICKWVLTAHNADFGVDSEIGKGSTFWFELKR